jgi:hypothetical protein
MMILGLSMLGVGVSFTLRKKKYVWLPPIILGGIGLIMIGLSWIDGIKDDWLGTIFIIFGMIFIFAFILTTLTILLMKYQTRYKK